MRIKKRQKVYGVAFGAGAFLVGWVITYLLAPANAVSGTPRWQAVTWVFLSGHYIEIASVQVAGLSGAGQSVDVANAASLPMSHALPPLLLVLSGVLATDVIGYTTRWNHLLRNSASVLLGYVPLLLIAYSQSMAQPAVAFLLTAAVVAFAALYVGSEFVGKATKGIPVLGVTSLGGLFLIGLFVLVVGTALVISLWTVAVIAAVSVVASAGFTYLARTVPT